MGGWVDAYVAGWVWACLCVWVDREMPVWVGLMGGGGGSVWVEGEIMGGWMGGASVGNPGDAHVAGWKGRCLCGCLDGGATSVLGSKVGCLCGWVDDGMPVWVG